jgi:hypothetical protein
MCGQALLVTVWKARRFCCNRLTGNHYRDFLLHSLPKLLKNVPHGYMHDGALAHFSCAVRDVLANTYHDRWADRGGPTVWPLSSPDLSPSGCLSVGSPKTLVNAAPVDNEEALHNRIVDACQTIRNYPCIFERMLQSMMRRAGGCIESHGGHFENLL